MKKPLVRSRSGRVSRNSGRDGCAYCGHSSPSGSTLEPRGVDDRLVLVGVQRADRVDDRAARLRALGRGAQQLELQLGQRAARASAGRDGARARRAPSTARRRARGRSRDSSSSRSVGSDDADVRRHLLRHRLCAAGVQLDRRHLAVQDQRLAARRRAARRARARRAASRRRAPRAATRGSSAACARCRPVRRRTRPGRRSARRPARRRAPRAAGGSFCARISDSASSRAEVARPDLGDPVGIRVLDRPFGQRRDEAAERPARAGA